MLSFDRLSLRTARLLLRPLDDNDAPALFEIFSNSDVMRYWSDPPWSSISQARVLIAQDREAMEENDSVRLGIERADSEKLVGTCTLFDWSEQCRHAEIGYALARGEWGRGYMTEALTALLNFGFSDMNLHRVEADIDPRNAASARVLERLGFQKEGFLRERWIVDGEVSDTAFYGLLRREWEARPNP